MRASRARTRLDLQQAALRSAGCIRIFEDKISGAAFRREGLNSALSALEPGGELVVWKLDRLGRSMLETVSIVIDLDRRGIGFRSLTDSFDTKTPIGRGVLAFIAAVAEDERARIAERTRAGMEAARRRGQRMGRRPKLTEQQIAKARDDLAAGLGTLAHLAGTLNVAPITLERALKRTVLKS